MLKTAPAVFAVENEYQIMVKCERECLFFLKVGDECYFDESNGIMRSICDVHRVSVPKKALEKAKKYTVCIRPIIERKPYFTETEDLIEIEYKFFPVPKSGARAYHISDAHNRVEGPIAAAKAFGDIDFLILNGDVLDHSGEPERFDNIYQLCSELLGGEKPAVFSRGNHDLRGNYAEKFAEYTPNHLGNTYYTFEIGSIWGLVMDCGEDKTDDHAEYGHTVACHSFRLRQTEFLKRVIKEKKFAKKSIKHRLLVSHVPFSYKIEAPFDIEEEVYREWLSLIGENIKPDAFVCGHIHATEVWRKGCEYDTYGQPCDVVIGGTHYNGGEFAGCGYIFSEDGIKVVFTNSQGEIISEERI